MKGSQRSLWVLTTEYEPHIIGGLGTVATHLTKQFASQGLRTTVLCTHKMNQTTVRRSNNLSIVRFPQKTLTDFTPSKLHRWMRQKQFSTPDHIHIHSLQFTKFARYFNNKFNTPIIYTCHSIVALETGLNSRHKLVKQQVELLKLANKIVVPSRWELLQLKKIYPFCANKIVVIKHGVQVRVVSRVKARGPRQRLLSVGRVIHSKGIEQLIRALALLKRDHPKAQLHVIGKGKPTYIRRLKRLAKQLGVAHAVRWHGFHKQTRVQQMYASYGALVMPSILGESFGLVALEALASGIPLVATRAGGLSEIVNKRVAEVLPNTKSNSIARAIERMWQRPVLTNKRVSAGLKQASRYRWSRVAADYKKLFK